MPSSILNLGSGKNYIEGAINADINEKWKPDVVMDISKQHPLESYTFKKIIAHDVLEHIPDLVAAMTNCLNILEIGGIMDIIVPYDTSYGAWQDPTHVRAFNERSWLYYTDWFWYLGWDTHRFELTSLKFEIDDSLPPQRQVTAMHVILTKIAVSR
jgi:SAM-dependent methyltransferase